VGWICSVAMYSFRAAFLVPATGVVISGHLRPKL
jgi:hypothetical protein